VARPISKSLDINQDAANIYALDTGFHRLPSGRVEASEIAIVYVKTSRIIVHAILDHSCVGLVATRMSRFLRSQKQNPTSPQHVPLVDTAAAGMMKQLQDCRFKENDMFVEYSFSSFSLPNLTLLYSVIAQHEDRDISLLTTKNTGLAVFPDIKALLFQALPLPTYRLHFLFRFLFPQDPLVDCNHSYSSPSASLMSQ